MIGPARPHGLRALLANLDQSDSTERCAEYRRSLSPSPDDRMPSAALEPSDLTDLGSIRGRIDSLHERARQYREAAKEYHASTATALLAEASELERKAASLEYVVVGRRSGFVRKQ